MLPGPMFFFIGEPWVRIICTLEQVLWLSGISCQLGCLQLNIGPPIGVPAPLLLIQLPSNASWEAMNEGPLIGLLLPTWDTQIEFLAPGFCLVQHWLLRTFGETTRRKVNLPLSPSLPSSLSPSLPLPFIENK